MKVRIQLEIRLKMNKEETLKLLKRFYKYRKMNFKITVNIINF